MKQANNVTPLKSAEPDVDFIRAQLESLQTLLKQAEEAKERANSIKAPGTLDAIPKVTWPFMVNKNDPDKPPKMVPQFRLENTQAMLAHYGISIKFNEMRKEMEIDIDHTLAGGKLSTLESKVSRIKDIARYNGYCDTTKLEEHVHMISVDNTYHPVRDWILSKPWDGVDRFEQFVDALRTTVQREYVSMLIKKWLISAVGVVMYDTEYQNEEHRIHGFRQSEGVLILCGKQGIGKTTWLTSLVPARSDWTMAGRTLSADNKDTKIEALSCWIAELGEMETTTTRSEAGFLKSFITNNRDKIRAPYAKQAVDMPRRTVFYGTVNGEEFLREPGRRWWVIPVDGVNVNHNIDIQQLWAQIYSWYLQGVPHWLDEQERELVTQTSESYKMVSYLEQKIMSSVRRYDDQAAIASGMYHEHRITVTRLLEILNVQGNMAAHAREGGQILRTMCGKPGDRNKYRLLIRTFDANKLTRGD